MLNFKLLGKIARPLAASVFFIVASAAQPGQANELMKLGGLKPHLSLKQAVVGPEQGAKSTPFYGRMVSAAPRLDTALARRWAMARDRIDAETAWLASCRQGACRDPRATRWHSAVEAIKSTAPQSRLAFVQNVFSRQFQYVEDPAVHDHWATPLSTFLARAGDCEDHAILKRALLQAAGVPETDMRLVILQTRDGSGHVVLHVSGFAKPVLDNRYRRPVSRAHLTGDRIAAIATDDGYFLVH
ncbi:MAG: transglutaminase-like cysteine peptidase [Roseibium sp.]|nr:transglutaminase-like cysteine peptidase [Roseibium sp.]